MTINDILKLDIQKKNFRKIESFINHATKDSFDYYKAVSYKALMFYKLSDVKEAITLLLTNLNETKNDDAIVSYSDSLIKIYLRTTNCGLIVALSGKFLTIPHLP